ncbi:MAG: VWA domain-containing protein [Moraxella sp.]|nr:VWA domain-containing protein [Moraxella sp.]
MSPSMLSVAPEYRPPIQNTERYQSLDPNPVHSVAAAPVSTFSVDVDTGSYANVRRFLHDGSLPPVGAVRVEEFVNYFDYTYPVPTDGKPFAVHSAVIDSPWQAGAKIVRIGIKAKEMSVQALPPANLVFLVDVSGSMNAPNKLTLAKQTLRLLTEQLRPQDTITLITYANGEKLVLPPTKGTAENKATILRVINELSAGGSTAGEQAIQLAYTQAEQAYIKDGINRILLLTDGDFNVGITDFDTLKSMVAQKRKLGVSLSTFGFGTGNYNEYMMEQLADAGDGNYSYIDNANEAKKVLSRQLSSTLATVAQDVKVQVEFNPATVKEYRLVGYENRMLDAADFNNDNVDAGDIGAGHTVTALYEIIPVGVQGWLNDRRYQPASTAASTIKGKADEYAHVALRYKLPNQADSTLITTPIKVSSVPFAKADTDSQWAIVAASFAESLKGGKYNGKMNYREMARLAKANQANDPYGLKAEFIELVGIADSLSSRQGKPSAE